MQRNQHALARSMAASLEGVARARGHIISMVIVITCKNASAAAGSASRNGKDAAIFLGGGSTESGERMGWTAVIIHTQYSRVSSSREGEEEPM